MLRAVVFTGAALLLVPLAANGQQQEPANVFSYVTYFYCDVTGQDLVDEVAKTIYAPVYDAAVTDGTITSWGWLAHHIGGKWRRVLYRSAPGIDALLDGADKVDNQISEKNPQAAGQIGRICNAHDDYIWSHVTGSSGDQGVQERGAAGFSVYMVCEMSKEERADELVRTVFTPIYNAQVSAGKLDSWSWMQHIVGGQYRRLLTASAKDVKTLMEARGAIVREMDEGQKAASTEFDSICNSHQDYIWDIQLEKP